MIRFAASFVQYLESKSKALRATIDYRTADGSATVGDNDYVGIATPVNLTISGGQTSAQIDVTINGDQKLEADETFQVLLSNLQASGRNAQLGTMLFETETSATSPIRDKTEFRSILTLPDLVGAAATCSRRSFMKSVISMGTTTMMW